MLILAGICILLAIVFPIWRIELDAPQYPEGLALHIYANKMGGDVDIVNGLNHYIGMKTIHAEEFIEFTVLPYIIGFFGLWALFSAYKKSKTSVLILLICFGLFGVLAMYDFWRWEYEYGHNLDPTAAAIASATSAMKNARINVHQDRPGAKKLAYGVQLMACRRGESNGHNVT